MSKRRTNAGERIGGLERGLPGPHLTGSSVNVLVHVNVNVPARRVTTRTVAIVPVAIVPTKVGAVCSMPCEGGFLGYEHVQVGDP